MKIAITGTRGIPNRYGGFEQFAEQLSVRLAQRGYHVWVYNPSFYRVSGNEHNKVRIINRFNPEKYIGPAANYIYDFKCLRDAIRRKADIILECGYATAAPAIRILNFRRSVFLINPDGMEWQRPKWNRLVRWIIRSAEKRVAESGYEFVCDSPELVRYYNEKYKVDPHYIPYGAEIFNDPDEKILNSFNILPFEYFLVIARFEPENNLLEIIKGFLNSQCRWKLVIVGDPWNNFGRKLLKEFKAFSNLLFKGDIFDQKILNNLRFYSKAYFHGHSAGGTNPSLLEAMSAGSLIIAHENRFNRHILYDNALYFNDENDITRIIQSENVWINKKELFVSENQKAIEKNFQWDDITGQYEALFKLLIARGI